MPNFEMPKQFKPALDLVVETYRATWGRENVVDAEDRAEFNAAVEKLLAGDDACDFALIEQECGAESLYDHRLAELIDAFAEWLCEQSTRVACTPQRTAEKMIEAIGFDLAHRYECAGEKEVKKLLEVLAFAVSTDRSILTGIGLMADELDRQSAEAHEEDEA